MGRKAEMNWVEGHVYKHRDPSASQIIHTLKWDKMAAILQTTFSKAFSWMKILTIKMSLKFVSKGPVDNNMNKPTLAQIMVWLWRGAKSSFKPNMFTVYWCIYVLLSLKELTTTTNVGPVFQISDSTKTEIYHWKWYPTSYFDGFFINWNMCA